MHKRRWAHTYLSTKPVMRLARVAVVMALSAVVGGACPALAEGKPKATAPQAAIEYEGRYKIAETELAAHDGTYLLLDLRKKRLRLKMRGVTVRDFRLTVISDSTETASFVERVRSGDRIAKQMARVLLFEAGNRLNDTVLGIVSEATKAPPDLIQRYIPERMTATFDGGLVLTAQTDVDGSSVSIFANLLENVRLFFDRLLGAKSLTIQVSADDAVALYGALLAGPPLVLTP